MLTSVNNTDMFSQQARDERGLKFQPREEEEDDEFGEKIPIF